MDRWALVDAFFQKHSMIQHQLDSYNQLISERIPEIVEETGVIETGVGEFSIGLGRVRFGKPTIHEIDGAERVLLPMEARMRNLSYMADIYVQMSAIRRGVVIKKAEIKIGSFPVMVKSRLCHLSEMNREELIEAGEDPLDPGGYFIINGREKVMVSFDEPAHNKIIVSKGSKSSILATAMVRSRKGAYTGPVSVDRRKDGIWTIRFPLAPQNMKLIVLLRALGFTDDREIVDAFTGGKEIMNDVMINLEASEIRDQKRALDVIGHYAAPGQVEEYRLRRAQEVIDNYLLPHIGTDPEDRKAKGYFLMRMAEMASEAAWGLRGFDDKDNLANKRVAHAGKLLENLFITAWRSLIRDIRKQVERAVVRRRKLSLMTVVRPNAFTDAVMFSMGTGTWTAPRLTGVTTTADRETFHGIIIQGREVKSPLSKRRQNFEARELHGTHFGRLGAIQTPEGLSCGLTRYLAMMATITTSEDEERIERLLRKMGVRVR